ESMLTSREHEIRMATARGRDIVERELDAATLRTAELRAGLRALSPGATLARGYAIALVDGDVIVRDAAQAPAGAQLVVTVGRGSGTRSAWGTGARRARHGARNGSSARSAGSTRRAERRRPSPPRRHDGVRTPHRRRARSPRDTRRDRGAQGRVVSRLPLEPDL